MARLRHFKNKLAKNERLYVIWCNMKSRCYDNTREAYKYYGAKGIKLCPEWENDFMAFYSWAKANGYRKNLTIDRVRSSDDYSPQTCQWIGRKANSRKQEHKNLLARL